MSERTKSSVDERLYEEPATIPFFQAVRLLRLLNPEREMVGEDADPPHEFVRFTSDRGYAHPVGDVTSVERGEGDEPDRMCVNFMGAASPHSFGSLPTPFIEEIRRQDANRDSALGDFIDLFNHRLVSLFFRAWMRSRPEILTELGGENPFERALRSIIGIEGDALRRQLPDDGLPLLARAGLLARRPAPAIAIESLIESIFGVPARVRQCVPTWYEMDGPERTRLGVANTRLGEDANLGIEVCLNQSHFRVVLGPMDFETYGRLLPEGESHSVLTSTVQLATGAEFDFDFSLSLRAEDVPRLRLGEAPPTEPANPCRLGWSTWINNEGFDRDADDSIFLPKQSTGLASTQETRI